uniref:Heparan-alpha-glucosaminide N-acetyltransferase catalytic domain-containing protein n=1 Tax=Chromera velia CCMP2878 TaxID=1169474 RepID=A0A0G4F878_9ALVE|eukprot:Cvel_15664.t1-p1 / transcript=Cvel_15664.t1 / gene=Cvel_15664 / organism=Chromera_velia_CCMP2878 / gene_product=Heparan-alpha-glucosaminide N-acetyltransferase, putative / transcript_product=Heparan-alpha-glucosaminide N-acetyltransferase, putative / location=Cvel_scaffold1169:30517-33791(-) / protein_length=591 / sequence_SO=supercontig / SO=protein_coding / is_pseudo=false
MDSSQRVGDGLPSRVSEGSVKKQRLVSLDCFRGLVIFGMVFVNYQPSCGFPLFLHPSWTGLSFADLVFPSFLFAMGMSIPFALTGPIRWFKFWRRVLMLFLLGLFVNEFPFVDFWRGKFGVFFENIRLMGVLQRLAVCYAFTAILFELLLKNSVRVARESGGQPDFGRLLGIPALSAAVLLSIYSGVLFELCVPSVEDEECGRGVLTPKCSAEGFVDRKLFGSSHLYRQSKYFDPEGALSTLTACLNCILGMMVGVHIRLGGRTKELLGGEGANRFLSVCVWMIGTFCLIVFGLFLWNFFPISKQIWTPPFAFITGGASLSTFAVCFFLLDALPQSRTAQSSVEVPSQSGQLEVKIQARGETAESCGEAKDLIQDQSHGLHQLLLTQKERNDEQGRKQSNGGSVPTSGRSTRGQEGNLFLLQERREGCESREGPGLGGNESDKSGERKDGRGGGLDNLNRSSHLVGVPQEKDSGAVREGVAQVQQERGQEREVTTGGYGAVCLQKNLVVSVLVAFGRNPLALYLLSESIDSLLNLENGDGKSVGEVWVFGPLLKSWMGCQLAGVVWSFCVPSLFLVPVALVLQRKGWYWRL